MGLALAGVLTLLVGGIEANTLASRQCVIVLVLSFLQSPCSLSCVLVTNSQLFTSTPVACNCMC